MLFICYLLNDNLKKSINFVSLIPVEYCWTNMIILNIFLLKAKSIYKVEGVRYPENDDAMTSYFELLS